MRLSPGLNAMVWSCVLCSLMGLAAYQAHLLEPSFSPVATSFVRVFANLGLALALPAAGSFLVHRRHWPVWLWGLSGSVTTLAFFAAVPRIGMGESTFLQASTGLFIALLAPLLAGQKGSWTTWLAMGGSLLGATLMSSVTFEAGDGLGKLLALLSGLSAAMAYLMVARGGESYPPRTLMVYWFAACFVVHSIWVVFLPVTFPSRWEVWALLVFAGICASASQYAAIRSYQLAPAAEAAVLSYLTPVLSLTLDAMCFGLVPAAQSLFGAALILGSCLWAASLKKAVPAFSREVPS